MKKIVHVLVIFFGLLFSLSSFAAAVIETLNGPVRAGASAAAATAVAVGQRLNSGSVVVTGPKALVTMRFDDGQVVALHENTEFKVAEYSFSKDHPAKDKYVFELVKGAMRSITALLTNRNRQAYALRTPAATIGIRGTDFMVAVVNPAYMSVLNGTIAVGNTAGTVTFGVGATATAASAATLASAIAASALPASVAAAFSQLGSLTIAAGAAGAVGTAAGGVTPAAVAAGVAAAAAVAAAASGGGGAAGTTGTTGTAQ